MAILTRILAIILLTGSLAAATEAGQEAPDFTLPSAAGGEVTLSEQRGHWVVLEWINFDCPFVRKFYGAGAMQELQTWAKGEGARWYAICSSASGKQGHFTGETLSARIAQEGFQGTAYLIDEDGTVGRSYGATHTPHMWVINPEGVVVYAGAIDSIRSANPEDIPRATNFVRAALTAGKAGEAIEVTSHQAYGCTVKYR